MRSEGWWGLAQLASILFAGVAVTTFTGWLLSEAADTLYLPGFVKTRLPEFIGFLVAFPLGDWFYSRVRRHFAGRRGVRTEDPSADSS